jgi:hypothetical protein
MFLSHKGSITFTNKYSSYRYDTLRKARSRLDEPAATAAATASGSVATGLLAGDAGDTGDTEMGLAGPEAEAV